MFTRESLEKNQIGVYVVALIVGGTVGLLSPGIGSYLEPLVSFIIAVLLFSMFCQIPFLKLREALSNRHFIGALLLVNFILVPLLVLALTKLFPQPSPVLVGVFLVLLTPCIDYVIVFTQLGKGNEKLILVSTPVLFVVQMIMLPFYLWLFIGAEASEIVRIGPFVEAFVYLIIVPLFFALAIQFSARKNAGGVKALNFTAWLPVPLMALVLFMVIGSQIDRVVKEFNVIIAVIPIYILFHIVSPIISRIVSSVFRIGPSDGRALIFSGGTRNSLVVLPLALTLPGEMATIAASVVVTQTIIELIAELLYIYIVPNIIYRDV
ncbi:bile acid:sodium symporter [Paenibacillus motobuensis]|uniref:arsenic resistance protein n=1 Tax=Paenibacillus TaxID=44249 RepID=UPI0020414700|nr:MULTISPECIES: bile acid:sodium symporter [Paenibacillus]MCM3039704.1 bile acid:sodium symporter [Paenibacillus lutimineralis]MCM3646808.1 bile acid:sodium symporter [Paenibacillus motobuensis]